MVLNIIVLNNKQPPAILLSITLHCIIIVALIWSSIYQQPKIDDSVVSMTAMLVDPKQIVRQHHQNKKDKQQAQQQVRHQKLKEKLSITKSARSQYKHFKNANNETKKVHVTTDKELNKNNKGINHGAQISAKKGTNKHTKKDNKNYDITKQTFEVDELLKDLIDTNNTPLFNKLNKMHITNNRNIEINTYKAMMSEAISKNFYETGNFSGKTCNLHIKLASDGMLISVITSGGDHELCQAAVLAAKLAKFPKPPNLQVYEQVKTATIIFSPQ